MGTIARSAENISRMRVFPAKAIAHISVKNVRCCHRRSVPRKWLWPGWWISHIVCLRNRKHGSKDCKRTNALKLQRPPRWFTRSISLMLRETNEKSSFISARWHLLSRMNCGTSMAIPLMHRSCLFLTAKQGSSHAPKLEPPIQSNWRRKKWENCLTASSMRTRYSAGKKIFLKKCPMYWARKKILRI